MNDLNLIAWSPFHGVTVYVVDEGTVVVCDKTQTVAEVNDDTAVMSRGVLYVTKSTYDVLHEKSHPQLLQ